jgi:hypothetical protein
MKTYTIPNSEGEQHPLYLTLTSEEELALAEANQKNGIGTFATHRDGRVLLEPRRVEFGVETGTFIVQHNTFPLYELEIDFAMHRLGTASVNKELRALKGDKGWSAILADKSTLDLYRAKLKELVALARTRAGIWRQKPISR